MACKYVEKCRKCGGGLKWHCTAAVPKKRIINTKFCLDPVKSNCAVYERAMASEKK